MISVQLILCVIVDPHNLLSWQTPYLSLSCLLVATVLYCKELRMSSDLYIWYIGNQTDFWHFSCFRLLAIKGISFLLGNYIDVGKVTSALETL